MGEAKLKRMEHEPEDLKLGDIMERHSCAIEWVANPKWAPRFLSYYCNNKQSKAFNKKSWFKVKAS